MSNPTLRVLRDCKVQTMELEHTDEEKLMLARSYLKCAEHQLSLIASNKFGLYRVDRERIAKTMIQHALEVAFGEQHV